MPDALAQAQDELARAMVPWPDDYVEDLTPTAALLLARQVSMCALRVATGAVASLVEDPDEEDALMHEVLNGCSAAVAGHTHALVALGVLPEEAEAALTTPATQ